MKAKPINMQYIKRLKETRKQQGSHLLNFYINLAPAARLMHSCREQFAEDKSLMESATRNYIIAITSCLETYYRDLFVDVLHKSESLLEKILQEVKISPSQLAELYSLHRYGVSFAEIAASSFSFQRIDTIDGSVSKLLQGANYLDALDSYELTCIIPSKSDNLPKDKLPKEWRKFFRNTFEKRHAFVHDANLKCDIASEEIALIEEVALQVAQITTSLVDEHFGEHFGIRLPGNGKPVFFIIEDLISDDWEVADQ